MKIVESLTGKSVFYATPKQAFSNETIINALRDMNFSVEPTLFSYKGKRIPGWVVNPEFVKMLYGGKVSFPKLGFSVYTEVNGVVRRFRLMEPAIQIKARAKRHLQAKNSDKAKRI
ncbi:hypothetical protein A3J77_00245 [Candidatus Wolfebacteria bacterium RBG_13_41_7]|uniref:Uncharacterized protein n=1 Tax=Candidatus Wolfebacteria bacterium RBG_13_41_7 TaxID=1802554 RepID=A0A1F8DNN5_9BACT|nr:MAG: hypothetical protein A3J77_00245 [Candidatus Wolfebacteria bacterium RBG_13_41_7]